MGLRCRRLGELEPLGGTVDDACGMPWSGDGGLPAGALWHGAMRRFASGLSCESRRHSRRFSAYRVEQFRSICTVVSHAGFMASAAEQRHPFSLILRTTKNHALNPDCAQWQGSRFDNGRYPYLLCKHRAKGKQAPRNADIQRFYAVAHGNAERAVTDACNRRRNAIGFIA